MTPILKLACSTDLMTGMIHRLGKALIPETGQASAAQAQHARALAMKCARCPDPAGCARLQATVTHLDSPPDFCPNRDALSALPDVQTG